MKFVFDKEKLLNALIPAAAIAPNRNTNYVLECVLFEYPSDVEGKCRITAYDMEKGMRTYVDCESTSEGNFAVNSQNILQIIRSMPEGEVNFEIDGKSRAKITSGNASFEIGATSGESYPSLPLLAGDKNYVLPQHIFRSLVNKTLFAVAQADMGKAFSGVLFTIENGKFICVGCDRNMLAVSEYDLGIPVSDHKFIIPAKILSDIMRSVKDSEDTIEICVARKHVIFKLNGYVYFSRLIDDEYFNYKKILALGGNSHVYVNCADFRYAVERASIVTEDKLGGKSKNSLIINYKSDIVEISSSSANGSIYDELPAATDGLEDGIMFKYNCRYILGVLRACEGTNTVCINLGGPTSGTKITNGDSDSKDPVSYTFYVMPKSNVK